MTVSSGWTYRDSARFRRLCTGHGESLNKQEILYRTYAVDALQFSDDDGSVL
jgi:hypothetical protein